jgi:hypothetical protein
MRKYACPSCGADIVMRSSVSVSAVCEYCQSLVVRTDAELELMGKVASLPEDMSPFQLGTQGTFGGVAFQLIGRLRMGWADGYWNEWFFAAEDGRKGWLAEAQGTFGVSYEVETPLHANTQRVLTQMLDAKFDPSVMDDRTVTLADKAFRMTDRKTAVCLGCEGELPLLATQGRQSVCLDFMGEPDEFASIDAHKNQHRLYVGRYVEWDDLKISYGREIEGWS